MRNFLITLALFLVACDPSTSLVDGELMTQDFDRTETPVIIIVHWHNSQGQIDKVFREFDGTDNPDRQAFAVWPKESNNPWCTIHALEPREIDDDRMNNLGHEVYHCLHGTFHE